MLALKGNLLPFDLCLPLNHLSFEFEYASLAMAIKRSSSFSFPLVFVIYVFVFHFASPFPSVYGKLHYNFYVKSCPRLQTIVKNGVSEALKNDTRMAASLLHLHFHDCFVNGCEASVLLDDTSYIVGEKNGLPDHGFTRGYEVIDSIKADLERACPSTVSCADILTLVARDSVFLVGGSYWPVLLGRRDGLNASRQAAFEQLASPFEPLKNITAKFRAKGLDLKDVVVLSGSHTIGFAQCFTFKNRLYNFSGSGKPDPIIDASALKKLRGLCPKEDESRTTLVPLDSSTVYKFDNMYYNNLVNNKALLDSDMALLGDARTAAMVKFYSANPRHFLDDFATSMTKMGNHGVLTGKEGQIRRKCGSLN